MSSLQEALNQRKSKIEKTVASKASASGKKKSKVRRRAEPVPPSGRTPGSLAVIFRPKSSTSGTACRRGKNKRRNRSETSPRGAQ